MINILAVADAICLILISACSVIVMQRDYGDSHVAIRASLALVGISAIWLAIWLLAEWVPSPAGFPPSRVVFDGTILGAFLVRIIYFPASKPKRNHSHA